MFYRHKALIKFTITYQHSEYGEVTQRHTWTEKHSVRLAKIKGTEHSIEYCTYIEGRLGMINGIEFIIYW